MEGRACQRRAASSWLIGRNRVALHLWRRAGGFGNPAAPSPVFSTTVARKKSEFFNCYLKWTNLLAQGLSLFAELGRVLFHVLLHSAVYLLSLHLKFDKKSWVRMFNLWFENIH